MLRKLLESMNCSAAPMWRFLCAKQLKMFKCWRPKKKSAWTDLDRVSFGKIFKESNVENEKSAWTGLDKSKKASSAASVFKILQDRSPGGRRCVLHFDGLPLTRGVVDAYTLRGCVFADIQSREEFTDALAS